jgi:hypothetical protein
MNRKEMPMQGQISLNPYTCSFDIPTSREDFKRPIEKTSLNEEIVQRETREKPKIAFIKQELLDVLRSRTGFSRPASELSKEFVVFRGQTEIKINPDDKNVKLNIAVIAHQILPIFDSERVPSNHKFYEYVAVYSNKDKKIKRKGATIQEPGHDHPSWFSGRFFARPEESIPVELSKAHINKTGYYWGK